MTRIEGVLAPVVTPFGEDLSPDADRLVRHCRWLTGNGVGLAPFGTTSEANSLSVDERIALLERLVDAGVDPARMMPGVGCCALPDTVRLTAHAVKLGCAGVLMLPPFFYKAVSEDGLFRSYAEVIERVADDRLAAYLYHIPPVSEVSITPSLIERLLDAYPRVIAGFKDSSGDWAGTKVVLDRFARRGFDVFVGSESFLLANLRNGGKGCISATANVNPAAMHALYAQWTTVDADAVQARLDAVRSTFQRYPMIPALKAATAHFGADAAWRRVRPPLVELDDVRTAALVADLRRIGFAAPGLGCTAD
ncbi:MAG TPA: dihydrodipicolinate synthase family protein [Planctomycetota bacterium]|nr:dihydrodipicolinate synthase family protein [Planctomycetota bacterium]